MSIDRLTTGLADRYVIERELGAGGMANVYLAEDRKHRRKVAVKVLRPELAAILGADRFLKEIEVTANLQHPNILPLYDSGEADSFLYYVMPLVEGESLRDRMNDEKQLGVEETVKIAESVASALAYAHEHGVVHRDIKPENIMLQSGQALVADFGIALAIKEAGGTRLTETGLSLGTPHYMSPEQATGDRQIDARSDVYSLGAMAYEMLTGEPPHHGNSVQAIVAKILTEDPSPITQTRSLVPPNVDAAIQKALAKSPADRFANAGDFAAALTNPAFHLPQTHAFPVVSQAPVGPWNRLSLGLAVLAAVAILVAGWEVARPETPAAVLRFSMAFADEEAVAPVFGTSFARSPDGSRIVYTGLAPGGIQLWLRERNALHATPLSGTAGGYQPFFSPDGQRVGYLVIDRARELNVMSLTGEPPVTLTAESVFRLGGTWGPDGYIYYSIQPQGGLARIPESGGAPEVISTPDTSLGHVRHAWPHALPGGKGVIVIIEKGVNDIDQEDDVAVVDLATGETRVLVRGVWGSYSPTGHLVFLRFDGALLAAPFDQRTLQLTGPAEPLLADVAVRRGPDVSLSLSGTLLYGIGEPASQAGVEVAWIDREGGITPVEAGWTVNRQGSTGPRLSPDGRRISLALSGPEGDHVWIKRIDGPLRRLTFEGTNSAPEWSPDGESILFKSDRNGQADMFRKKADGLGVAEPVHDPDVGIWQATLSPDAQWLVYRANPMRDVYAFRLGTDSTPRRLLTSSADEGSPAISPDGRWLTYVAFESGTWEVYVAAFPNVADGKWQISRGGGVEPVWSPKGDELFFTTLQGDMMAVPVTTRPSFSRGEPVRLFTLPLGSDREFIPTYDVSADGRRFLTYRPVSAGSEELIVVENFFEELKQKVANE